MVQKKGAGKTSEYAEEELARAPLQAILLADSFAQKFRPITLEKPKVLLPLVNVPMIDYTLAWLESAGVEEVFVFVCAHSKQVIDYVNSSQWFGLSNFSIKTIESHNCISAGDALRFIYERNVINGDFILISGDTVSNMSLTEALEEHKERKKKDSNAVMTMVIKRSKPSPVTHQSRLGTDELFMAIDPDSKQLLYYEDKGLKGIITLDKSLLSDNMSISFHNDKQDCYIDICSPEVLSLFTDNFDYQHLRRHFVKGLLLDDIMGYKIYVHEIHSSYAARIDNFRSYDTISKDIIQRWTYPFVPDVFGRSSTKHERQGVYRAAGVVQSRSAQIGPFALVGSNTTIGDRTKIYNSVVGEGCNIGSDVSIDGCYIWDNVIIENGCKLSHAIVCDGVTIKPGAVLEPGVVLSFNVVIGQGFVVPAYSKVSLHQQPTRQDSDEELEYADDSSGVVKIPAMNGTTDHLSPGLSSELSEAQGRATSEVGTGGVGYMWSIDENSYDEEMLQSVAPIPAEKLAEIVQSTTDELEITQDGNLLPPSGELPLDSNSAASGDDDMDDIRDDYVYFEKEVEATFQRAVHEDVKEDHVILEVNSLRLSCNKTSADCAGALFYSMVKLAVDTPHSSNSELHKIVINVITTWQKVLKYYLLSLDEEIEVILKFEEICLETIKELRSLFTQVLHFMYDKDILKEEAILNWADEKEGAEERDKVLVKEADKLIQWLKDASEEEDDEHEEDED